MEGEAEISAPKLVDGPADLRCTCDLQPGGAGDFYGVSARVTGGAIVCQAELPGGGLDGAEVETSQAVPTFSAMVVPLANVGVSKPADVRKGRPYCIKLSLPEKDRDGHSKHVLSFQDQATFDMWLQGLREDFGGSVGKSSAAMLSDKKVKLSMRSAALMASLASNPDLQARAQHAELQSLNHAGWMAKKGGVRRNWQKRYFEHSGDFLFYREEVGGDLKGTIDLSLVTDVRPSTEIDHKQWEMEIVSPTRTYRLDCETQEELKRWFLSLAKYSLDPQALAAWVPHQEGQAVAVQARYLVLAKATARQAPDDKSLKVGEFDPGQVIACIEELTDAGGIVRVRSSTAPKGAPSGGWLKKSTSKEKALLQRVPFDESARALREQPVFVECGGEEVACTLPVGVLMIIHERKPPAAAEGVEMLRVAFSKTKQGWVKMCDDAGLLLEIRKDPVEEAEALRLQLVEEEVEEPEPDAPTPLPERERFDWTADSGNGSTLNLAKHDPMMEAEVVAYIEKMTGSRQDVSEGGENSLCMALKDGQVLCAVANAVRPGVVKKVHKKNLPAIQMENIGHFLSACTELGLASSDLFHTPDLWDGVTVGQQPLNVMLCILRLRDLHPEPGSGVVEEQQEAGGGATAVEEGVPPEAAAAPARVGRARARTLELTAALPRTETELDGEVNTPITQADLGTCP
eukprot:COSAG02_NODE_2545_length_8565_cov_7.011339_2_plen_687_part_00